MSEKIFDKPVNFKELELLPEHSLVLTKAKKYFTTLRRRIILLLLVIGASLIVLGLMTNASKNNEGSGKILVNGFTEINVATEAGTVKSKTIMVDIEGAVVRPGVIEVPDYSRIKDVLIAAEGLDAKADRIYVSKSINLAQRVSDGMKLYIPFIGELVSQNNTGAINVSPTTSITSINTATTEQLDALPGIGPVTVTKIINGRPYQSVSDLLDRKILTNGVYQKIKDLVSL